MKKNAMTVTQAFSILGIASSSPAHRVHQAYRQLVKRWHPDQFAQSPGLRSEAESRLKTINQAYAIAEAHLQTRPEQPSAGTQQERSPRRPDSAGYRNPLHAIFGSATQYRGGPKRGPNRRSPHPRKPSPGTDFQHALQSARSRHKVFKRSSVAPAHAQVPRPGYAAYSKRRSGAMRIDPAQSVIRIRPIAPIEPIGKSD